MVLKMPGQGSRRCRGTATAPAPTTGIAPGVRPRYRRHAVTLLTPATWTSSRVLRKRPRAGRARRCWRTSRCGGGCWPTPRAKWWVGPSRHQASMKSAGPRLRLQAAVGVADLQHRPRDALALRGHQLVGSPARVSKSSTAGSTGPSAHLGLHPDPGAIACRGTAPGRAAAAPRRDGEVERAVVAGQDEVLAEVHRGHLRVRSAAGAEGVDDLHRLAVLEVALPAARHESARSAASSLRAKPAAMRSYSLCNRGNAASSR